MARFTVRRVVDAYAVYEAEVEAETPKAAAEAARNDEEQYQWAEAFTQTFDARNFVTMSEDGGEIEETKVGDL